MKLTNDPHMMRVAVLFGAISLVLFGASFNDPFHFDDALITADSNVTNPGRWTHFLNPLHLRQLTFFTFYLNHLLGGIHPSGYHVVNVALHTANAVLLFALAVRFFDRWIAIAAAALFLVHPVQSQPVLYVYERSALLACFFSLLALIAISQRRNRLAILFFLCAFASKETALAVPLAVATLALAAKDFSWFSIPNERSRTRAAAWLILVFVVVLAGGALGLLRYWGEESVGIGVAQRISPLHYLGVQTRVIYTYFRLLIFPYPQSLEYDFPEPGGFLAVIGLVLIIGIGWRSRRSVPGLCVLAFFILLSPTSSIIPSADAAFEHRLYVPMLAFALLAAYTLARIRYRNWIGVSLFIALGILTVRRGAVWSSDIALWEDTVKHAPAKARVWFNLGGAYLDVDSERARSAFLRALELQPHFPQAYYSLGVIERGKSNWAMSLAYFRRAIEQYPAYWPAWNNAGNTLFALNERARALEYFEETLRLNRDYWPAQYNIAIVHFMTGRYREAEHRLRTVLDWRPDLREARYLLATTLTRAGDRASADVEWKKLGELHAAESRITPTMILAPSRP